MSIVKIAKLFKELASKIDETFDQIDCNSYDTTCNGCPLMALQTKWVNWKLEGTCIAEMLLGEE